MMMVSNGVGVRTYVAAVNPLAVANVLGSGQ